MKIDPYYQRAKCRPMTLVSSNITYARVPEGTSNDMEVVDNVN